MQEFNLFWFGLILELGIVVAIFRFVRPAAGESDRLQAKLAELKQDYQRLQEDYQQTKTQLSQDCVRLRQELQQQNDQLLQDHLTQQRDWQQQQTQLTQERDRLQQKLEQTQQVLVERDQPLQAVEQQLADPAQAHPSWQQQVDTLTADLHHDTFRTLQTLLVNYPSASKIAHAKPDLPAKNLTSMFAPLENLIHDWGYEVIGPIWGKVTYAPQLHQPDVADIQPGEMVYIRFVGYRHGETILCPAKVSRQLPGVRE